MICTSTETTPLSWKLWGPTNSHPGLGPVEGARNTDKWPRLEDLVPGRSLGRPEPSAWAFLRPVLAMTPILPLGNPGLFSHGWLRRQHRIQHEGGTWALLRHLRQPPHSAHQKSLLHVGHSGPLIALEAGFPQVQPWTSLAPVAPVAPLGVAL